MKIPALALLIAVALTACAPAQARIITVPSSVQAQPTAGQATLLVANHFPWPLVNVLDGQGKVVGQLTGKSHFVTHQPAGPIKLYAFLNKDGKVGDRVEGTVEAGRLYYLTVGYAGVFTAGLSFTVLSQRLDPEVWKERRTYETERENLEIAPARLSELEQDLGDTRPILSRIDEFADGHDAKDKAARTLQPGDGEGS